MAINYVDYEVLAHGQKVYSEKAQQISDVLTSLRNMNNELSEGWKNDTARAFVERFNEEFDPALRNVEEALESISTYISKYSQNRSSEDAEGASAISR